MTSLRYHTKDDRHPIAEWGPSNTFDIALYISLEVDQEFFVFTTSPKVQRNLAVLAVSWLEVALCELDTIDTDQP